jgi:chaperonin GroEL
MSSVLNDVYVLIADYKFTSVKELLPILEGVSQANKSLLVIAEDIDGEALSTLVVNKMRGTLKVCAVRAPEFGDRRKLLLEDIAILTGGTVFDKDKGMKLDKFNWEWFGEARTVTVTKDTTTIVDGKGDETKIQTRAEELEAQIDKSTTPYEMEKLQERLAKFIGGVAIVHVGGNTETEMKETKDRVDDALHATKAAVEEGIVPGGGVALIRAKTAVKDLRGANADQDAGINIVLRAIEAPLRSIVENAGVESSVVVNEIVKGNGNYGFNAANDTYGDMLAMGVVDPTKVTRCALQNAAGVAGLLLTKDCAINELPKEDKADHSHGMHGMM